METVTLILPLEATTVTNPSNISGVKVGAIAGATSGVTAAAAEQQRSDSGLITEQYRSNTGVTAERQQECQWSDSRSDSSSDSVSTAGEISGATAGVTAAAAEQQRSDSGLITER